ncbi:MAG: hypothetical protein GYB31_09520 [Bacteroidetes bacterium]|nr:hypothetical protein [Bacteroidota bacterium]
MSGTNEPLETLSEIRSMMERSSRFISLSGLSGVFAGCAALVGSALTYFYLDTMPFGESRHYYAVDPYSEKWGLGFWEFAMITGISVLIIAVAGAIYFTSRKARRKGQPAWNTMSRRLLLNLAIPLIAGGVFILALLRAGVGGLVAPATLIFYGLGLLNASKYTLNDIRYLGVAEVALGLIASFFPGHGLEFWTIGFGILHILYGIILYRKYERA